MRNIKNYIDYLKDNPERYWFKRKLFGWGWVPATREGWTVVALTVIATIVITMRVDESASDEEIIKQVVFPVVAIILLLIVITWRTGEPPKWMFGLPKKKEESKFDV